MATVNITTRLIDEIKKNVATPFKDRYETATIATREDSIKLYDSLMVTPDQVELLNKLPDSWIRLSKSNNFTHKLYVGHASVGSTSSIARLHYVRLDLPTDPRYYDYGWTYSPSSTAERIEQTNSSWMHTDLSEVELSKDYVTTLKAITAERDQLIATVTKMLEGCKTLNQVEKVWPAIRKYVGREICDRLDKKVERKRSAADIGITDDELQALSVHHIRQQMTA